MHGEGGVGSGVGVERVLRQRGSFVACAVI